MKFSILAIDVLRPSFEDRVAKERAHRTMEDSSSSNLSPKSKNTALWQSTHSRRSASHRTRTEYVSGRIAGWQCCIRRSNVTLP